MNRMGILVLSLVSPWWEANAIELFRRPKDSENVTLPVAFLLLGESRREKRLGYIVLPERSLAFHQWRVGGQKRQAHDMICILSPPRSPTSLSSHSVCTSYLHK
jgi:hypothetical protein